MHWMDVLSLLSMMLLLVTFVWHPVSMWHSLCGAAVSSKWKETGKRMGSLGARLEADWEVVLLSTMSSFLPPTFFTSDQF